MSRRLTQEQEQEIVSLYLQNTSTANIQKQTGRSKNSVHKVLHKHGYRRSLKLFTPEVEQEIVKLYQQGMSLSQLQRQFECSNWTTFCNILKRHGIERRKRGATMHEMTEEEQKVIIQRWQDGESRKKICDELDVSYEALRCWMIKQGIKIEDRHNKRERHGNWVGGKIKDRYGYVKVLIDNQNPFYCMAHYNGYVREHRLVIAQHLGRPLEKHEEVHHLNGNKEDNRIENLQLRSGKHGKGECWKCADCGSKNIVAISL